MNTAGSRLGRRFYNTQHGIYLGNSGVNLFSMEASFSLNAYIFIGRRLEKVNAEKDNLLWKEVNNNCKFSKKNFRKVSHS